MKTFSIFKMGYVKFPPWSALEPRIKNDQYLTQRLPHSPALQIVNHRITNNDCCCYLSIYMIFRFLTSPFLMNLCCFSCFQFARGMRTSCNLISCSFLLISGNSAALFIALVLLLHSLYDFARSHCLESPLLQ